MIYFERLRFLERVSTRVSTCVLRSRALIVIELRGVDQCRSFRLLPVPVSN
jgi:hypothetical protein